MEALFVGKLVLVGEDCRDQRANVLSNRLHVAFVGDGNKVLNGVVL